MPASEEEERIIVNTILWYIHDRMDFMHLELNAETSAPRNPPTGGGAHKKGGPVKNQYVVLFNQRMIKVP